MSGNMWIWKEFTKSSKIMIKGHGDNSYEYSDIHSDFSSNICPAANHDELLNYLASRRGMLDHYPEPEAWSLEKMIAERLDITPEQVIVTNGATEAIYLIAQSFDMEPVIPTPTFSEYEDACQMFPCSTLSTEHSSAENKRKTILWLCNPNNPTGAVYDQLFIDRMMAEHGLVVLDQSYEHYTDQLVMNARWAGRTPYSLQIHSFTKTYSVPGLRLGYITGHPDLTAILRRHLHPWSVSSIAIEAGKYLLQHDEFISKPDLQEAQRLYHKLCKIPGISLHPTKTNFMLCKIEHIHAVALKEYLIQEHRMLIRDASNFRGLTPHHFRISAQTPSENDALVKAIDKYCRNLFHQKLLET